MTSQELYDAIAADLSTGHLRRACRRARELRLALDRGDPVPTGARFELDARARGIVSRMDLSGRSLVMNLATINKRLSA